MNHFTNRIDEDLGSGQFPVWSSQNIVITIFLFLVVFFSVTLSYFWIGPLPAWAGFSTLGLIYLYSNKKSLRVLKDTTRKLIWYIIIPWIIFLFYIALRDTIAGTIGISLTNRIGVNVFSLAAMIFVITACRLLSIKISMLIFSFILFIQGLVGIAQFTGSYTAWTLPDKISAYSSKDVALYDTIVRGKDARMVSQGFEGVGRVRGLHVYVHMFSGYQGVGGFFVLAFGLLFLSRKQLGFTRYLYAFFGFISALAIVLTFTRSVTLGLIIGTLIIFLYYLRKGRFGSIILLCGLAGIGTLALLSTGLLDASQFTRFGDTGLHNASDYERYMSIVLTLSAFLSNPILGAGTGGIDLGLPVHCVPIRMLGDFGIMGFTFYAWVWLGIFLLLIKGLRCRLGTVHLIALAAFGALFVAMIDNLTHSSGILQRGNGQAVIFAFAIGLIMHYPIMKTFKK
jgi:hypothetical protein